MCGILGFNWKDENLAQKLGDLIAHRGPDDEGFFSDENITLGHRRLSIIDLSEKGHQPMHDDEQKYYIVYNGEIFNFPEIREELQQKGYEFKSDTDTEVVLLGYKEYGKDILQKLNGQFSFGIYDQENSELFLARDRIGINPLYYYFDNEKFVFSSQLKVILQSGIKKDINQFAFEYYLMYGYTPRHQSIIENGYKLEPGHYMIFDLQENKIKEYNKYRDITITGEIKDEEEAKQKILEELESSVQKRLVSDVPVGAFLSGGVDSSAVVAIMKKYKDDLDTFSVKFDYDDFDESEYADQISKQFDTNHHVIEFGHEDVRKLIYDLPNYYDEPFGDPSLIPTFLVSKVARENVTVSLSGDGGDELFGGYDEYHTYKLLDIQRYYPKFINMIFYNLLKPIKSEKASKIKAFFELGTLDRSQKFPRLMSYLEREEAEKLLGEDIERYYDEYGKQFQKSNFLDEATNIDLHNYLTEDILTKVDRASLANSLESRPPFLDHNVMELAARINYKLKYKNGEGKYILKKALEKILPQDILYRKKQGFGVPLRYYFTKELKDVVQDYVFDYKGHNLINQEFLEQLQEKMKADKWGKDYSRILWSILMFNLWYEKWM